MGVYGSVGERLRATQAFPTGQSMGLHDAVGERLQVTGRFGRGNRRDCMVRWVNDCGLPRRFGRGNRWDRQPFPPMGSSDSLENIWWRKGCQSRITRCGERTLQRCG
jgi:hypothetical protein